LRTKRKNVLVDVSQSVWNGAISGRISARDICFDRVHFFLAFRLLILVTLLSGASSSWLLASMRIYIGVRSLRGLRISWLVTVSKVCFDVGVSCFPCLRNFCQRILSAI
jgi:hypothetical protein